jgi:hypothetical protein
MYGDKETFWMGFEVVSEPFSFHTDLPGTMGFVEDLSEREWRAEAIAKNYGRVYKSILYPEQAPVYRICSAQLLHSDENGNPSWINGGLFENKYFANYSLAKFDNWVISPSTWEYHNNYPCAYFSDKPKSFATSQTSILEKSGEIFNAIFIG